MEHFYSNLPRRVMGIYYCKFFPGLFFILLVIPFNLFAGSFTVNTNDDSHAVSAVAGTGLDAGGKISLRSALQAATATAGSHTIQFSISGTITLTLGQITVGSAAAGNNITITGPGMNMLTINQTTRNRIFSTGTGAVSFSLADLTLNYTGPGPTTGSILGGGGAIIAGGAGAVTSLTNVKISNFSIQRGNGGAISQSSSTTSHNLTITNCIFSNNLCGGAGGAVSFNSQGGTCIITGTLFENNMTGLVGLSPDTNPGSYGGAITTTGGGSGGTYTISSCTFINNQAAAQGGAIANVNGNQATQYCRFLNNSAAVASDGNVFWQSGGSTSNTIIANNNWWGTNSGPAVNDLAVGAAPVTAPIADVWLQLKASASPATICSGTPATITAGFLKNSADQTISAADLKALVGVSISFSASLGTLSGAQPAIQANGNATVDFNANGTEGTVSVNAVVDNVPGNDAVAKANLTINVAGSFTGGGQPAGTTVCIGKTAIFSSSATGSGTLNYQWYRGVNALANGTTGTGSEITGANTHTLNIENAGNSDVDANYQVKVTNVCGTTGSGFVSLSITDPTIPTANTSNNSFTVSSSRTIITDNSCKLIAKLVPSGIAPVAGTVSAKLTIDAQVETAVNGNPYVQRHYDIEPASNAGVATATVTLYFLQAEFDAFNAHPSAGTKLPTGAADAAGIANLRIFQFHGVGTGIPFNTPVTYPDAGIEINPDDDKVVFNNTLNSWEVTIEVTGFSGFFAGNAGINILPLKLVSFSGVMQNGAATLHWTTSNELNTSHFELQRSTNGRDFNKLADIPVADNITGDQVYQYVDNAGILANHGPFAWYRLKMVDTDGKFTYSKMVVVNVNNKTFSIAGISNPIRGNLQVNIEAAKQSITTFLLMGMDGKILLQHRQLITPGSNSIRINLGSKLPAGNYMLQVQNPPSRETFRLMKLE